MTLWVFGDSFAETTITIGRNSQGPTGQWCYQIAHNLNAEIYGYGLGGSSLDYTYYRFNQIRNKIRENDTIIVALTEINRRWFWKDSPQNGCVQALDLPNDLATAYKYYMLYLNNPIVYETHLITFLHDLNNTSLIKNIKTVILPCFEITINNQDYPHLHIAKGNLLTVSLNEFKKNTTREMVDPYFINDRRINHIIKDNHTILANKILNYIRYNKSINLTNAFLTEKIDKDDFVGPYNTQYFWQGGIP